MNEIQTEKLLPQGLQDWLNAKRECMAQANDIHNEIIDKEMKTLHLPLKAQWYKMIDSCVKTEEYREIKPYWLKRLLKVVDLDHTHYESLDDECIDFYMNNVDLIKEDWRLGGFQQTGYTHVKFSYGYTKRTMTFEIESITIGKGKPEWGAPNEEVFIIKLGNRV